MALVINFKIKDVKGSQFSFTSVGQLKEFALREAEYWKEKWLTISGFGPRSQHQYIAVHSVWKEIYDLIEKWKENLVAWDSDTANANLSGQYPGWINQLQGRWIWSGHPQNEVWVDSYKISQETGDAFIEALIGNNVGRLGSFNILKGVILAYEFSLQDESTLTKRRTSEERAFSRLRAQLASKKDELISEVDGFKRDFSEWSKGAKDSFVGWQLDRKEEFSNWRVSVDDKIDEKERGRASEWKENLESWRSTISNLEHAYQEKLRLAAPAAYWKKRAKELGLQGGLWASLLVSVSVILTVAAGAFFWHWLNKPAIPFGPQSLQGVALFGATATAAVFLVRTLSKLTFSAFHLQRDAEEKEQLTHLYLALVNEGAVDASSREIVLQALFSRAETGLLAGDSGPTMPGVDGIASLLRSGGGGGRP